MREKKPDKRKVQGAETKKKLYEIAERLFTERNFSDVNVEDITDEAGITKGAFYVHFESKDALIAILVADHAAKTDADYKTFLESLPDDMPASLVLFALAERIADTLANTFGCKNMTKIYQMLLSGTAGTEAVKGYGRELYALVYSILEKGLRSGEFTSSLPLETLSRHFVMAIRGVSYEWCVRYPHFDLKEQAIEHTRLLIEGMKASCS
ncbi:TetR/AcrR family transcriptional regulator [Lacrimispora saccharolytica]|uniref:Transcriptional regulator, TetR family n=1 Tax=Lacrimispora saccharolytica (strain ATCC 35040 / DSM 2544 / NRCC 2533 / WM1) TaxID=610130 RepID=D9RA77_LACSW|nr:TetR/AcrR family transcriptional regulator [Lacrimispora saccharolytica]ADL06049.1 transcriptional regulator, TetR family [[Clostridium] saccharolyticum WM1]QRV19831.1 TetR/AcrR family transcriptional regulator [Lacrimispora saccharolytica]